MPGTYLTVRFADKDAVKALGAKWDGQERKWYVPDGRDLAAFQAWLPSSAQSKAVAAPTTSTLDLQATVRGKSLSQLLAGVSGAVSRAYPEGEWTIVEVVQAQLRNHVYLELTERDSAGAVLAKAGGMIWSNVAQRILPQFEKATGISIGAGIKLLVRAKPEMSSQYGFRLTIDAIDPNFTLGDLEAKKREIRVRLQQEGVWENNKALAFPWDFNQVLVVAPSNAAGLGDFEIEARRLQSAGLCRFVYAHSRFQGEGAAAEILKQLSVAISNWQSAQATSPDAVVIIRGGGAVNDLAWLNDYALAQLICILEVPVLTGIGHERDSTILDEVSNTSFDTPSKVIAGIEARIALRAREAMAAFGDLVVRTRTQVDKARRATDRAREDVVSHSVREIHQARTTGASAISEVRLQSVRSLGAAGGQAMDRLRGVRERASTQLALGQQKVPLLLDQVRDQARTQLFSVAGEANRSLTMVVSGARTIAGQRRRDADASMAQVAHDAQRQVIQVKQGSEALIREISGQGPQKTLERGFAIIRHEDGATVSSAEGIDNGVGISVTFRDGTVHATVSDKELKS